MADIRINALTLCNFKGLRNETFNFNGKNGVLVGDNGTGKSTVFDAFIWLLFGKDSRNQDQTKFDIKTIDAKTGEPMHRAEHSVEAMLTVDGVPRER